MKLYNLSIDGLNYFNVKEITNPREVPAALAEKAEHGNWNLSVNGSGIIDCNPATPLYIYGAQYTTMIVNERGEIVYSSWQGEHAEYWNGYYLQLFRRCMKAGIEYTKTGGLVKVKTAQP